MWGWDAEGYVYMGGVTHGMVARSERVNGFGKPHSSMPSLQASPESPETLPLFCHRCPVFHEISSVHQEPLKCQSSFWSLVWPQGLLRALGLLV